jgi:hypothetical protein
MIEDTNDKLYRTKYLGVSKLLIELKDIASKNSNMQSYSYLMSILMRVDGNCTEWLIKTEKHILSPDFLNQRDFKDIDREYMIPVIREYKLNQLI